RARIEAALDSSGPCPVTAIEFLLDPSYYAAESPHREAPCGRSEKSCRLPRKSDHETDSTGTPHRARCHPGSPSQSVGESSRNKLVDGRLYSGRSGLGGWNGFS